MNAEIEETILKHAGIRPTANRILVLREFQSVDSPMSLMDLESRLDTLDKSSIFRVIMLFAERGIIRGVEDGRGVTRYEPVKHDERGDENEMHAHFFCENCGKTVCFHGIPAPLPELPEGYSLSTVNFMMKGSCPACSKKKGAR